MAVVFEREGRGENGREGEYEERRGLTEGGMAFLGWCVFLCLLVCVFVCVCFSVDVDDVLMLSNAFSRLRRNLGM